MSKETTLGRKHSLDKRNWESRLKRLNINIGASRPIYVDQILKVYPMVKTSEFVNKVVPQQSTHSFNIKVRELEEKGYSFVEGKGCWKKR